MKFSTTLATISTLALAAFSAHAQSTTTASSTTSSGAPAATSALPQCVTKCQASSAILASCVGAADISCICSLKSRTLYQTAVDNCIRGACPAEADSDIAAANQAQSSTCLAFASGLAGKTSASSTSGASSSSNAAGSARPLALDGLRVLGVALGTLVLGSAVGATAL